MNELLMLFRFRDLTPCSNIDTKTFSWKETIEIEGRMQHVYKILLFLLDYLKIKWLTQKSPSSSNRAGWEQVMLHILST
jgi:hypothetical protein